jgi:hypothetical protein
MSTTIEGTSVDFSTASLFYIDEKQRQFLIVIFRNQALFVPFAI